jgi:putative tryptophan/tyrosine transport system substrate-binding protein
MMSRREFIALASGAAAVWPIGARAQQDQMRRIGILIFGGGPDSPFNRPVLEQIKSRLQALGWVEGRNIQFETRWSEGSPQKVEQYAKQLVDLHCDAIIAQGPPTVAALQRETNVIPIVFWLVPDPVGQGLITNLARPGANVTGFTNFEFSIATKWLEILKEIEPATARASVVFNPAVEGYAERFLPGSTRLHRDSVSRSVL